MKSTLPDDFPTHELELLRERDALNGALLAATANLARGQDPDAVLRRACDALVSASCHIRLAWMYLGDADPEILRPAYAAGPAEQYAAQLVLVRSDGHLRGPTRRCLHLREPVIARVCDDPAFEPWRAAALHHGLQSCACFPVGIAENRPRGVVVIYADDPDYFERVGIGPFLAFTHLGEASLEEATLRRQLEDLATFDHLTGLLNRAALQGVLEREHARAQRTGRPYSLLLFDIDRFKLINDHYGHGAGDKVLFSIAGSVNHELRDSDSVGRWGGEEFLCLLPETDNAEAARIAERLRRTICAEPVAFEQRMIETNVSVGVATWPENGSTIDELLALADATLYEAKRAGRNRVVTSTRGGQGILSIAAHIERALRTDRVRAAYQPIVDITTGAVVGEEALARIVDEDGKLMEATTFIEAASQLQLVHRIDDRIVRATARRCTDMTLEGHPIAHFVNISADLLRHTELIEQLLSFIIEQCTTCGDLVRGDKPLIIEITEREFLGNTREAREILAPFTDFGLRLAVDDFGSGYSSFRYLADLPIAFLKIEGDLVRRAPTERRVRDILQGIQDIADDLELITLAECVESEAMLDVLRDVGVHWGQGYLFGRPEIQ